ncbi:ABC transporter substrate-binding protein [Limnohabitans sp.]|uniref:ABC transporter substrate-binding protein n=1 Tax=Limnohabitans sp. TaxID=1907725 RepID=UPI0038B85750
MDKRSLIKAMVAAPIVMGLNPARAQNKPFKIGLLTPMTGPFASTGKQMLAGVKLYMAQQGVNIAGRQVELIVKDDTGMPDVTKRLAQELVVNDKVDVLAGFGLTPLALATGPIATQSKTPMVNMLAATSAVIDASPYMVRVSMTLPQITVAVAEWASKNNIRKVVTLVSDYGPGIDAERTFVDRFLLNGGQVQESLRVPMRSPDFSPFLQKVRDLSPDAVFVFVPSGIGTQVMKQFNERGLARAGIRLIGTGDVVDDDILNSMGDATLGIVTSYPYSTDHPSALNKKFVAEFKKANQNMRPNAVAVFGYDGTRLIYDALKKTAGKGDGDALLAAMKGQIFESPRGQIYIDANTRDIVQSVYVRKVEKVNGELYNVEFQEQKDVRDPPRAR